MFQATLPCAAASVVGSPRPRRLPSGPEGWGDGVGRWFMRVMLVWRLIQLAIASREGVYAVSAAIASSAIAAASAQQLWNHARGAGAGVAGQSIASRRRSRLRSSSAISGTRTLLDPLPQARERSRQTRLDRALGDA